MLSLDLDVKIPLYPHCTFDEMVVAPRRLPCCRRTWGRGATFSLRKCGRAYLTQRTHFIDRWTQAERTHVSISQKTHPPRPSGGDRNPFSICGDWRATVCFLVHFTLHCSLHTPKPPRHTKSKTLFLCPSVTAANLRLAIEGGTHQMARVERQPRNPSRLAPTSHPAPAPPTTPAARRPGTPRNAAQVIGPFLPLCATALLFLKSSCRSRFPSVGFCWGEVKCDAFFFPGMLFLLSVCRAGVLCSRLLVRGTMRKYFILILL